MARTKKGSKGPGHEYWSRRPHSNSCGCPVGKLWKKLTHKAERQEERSLLLATWKETSDNSR